tara:strand:+ start:42 stop:1262 length:1221 start_codon:yes stop_codon:yes gene_type:complete
MKLIMENWRRFVLDESTIRTGRIYYYVSPSEMPKYGVDILKAATDDPIEELEDRVFVQARMVGDNRHAFDFFLLPEKSDSTYGLREDVLKANQTRQPTEAMKSAAKIGEYERKVELGRTKIRWLQTRPEELRKENEELLSIKHKFLTEGIGPAGETHVDSTGLVVDLRPATIYVKGRKIEDVVAIDKIKMKNGVGDFGLFDSNGNLVFSISHKALGFERYASMISTMKSLAKKEKSAAVKFIRDVSKEWKRDVFSNQRSTKGYYRLADEPEIASLIVYLIYGEGVRQANSLFVGEMSLEERADGFDLGVADHKGNAIYLNPELPDIEEYLPIFKSRYGSGGSKIAFSEYDQFNLNQAIQAGHLSVSDLDSMKVDYKLGDFGEVKEVSVPVRFYVSPLSRNDGAEEI